MNVPNFGPGTGPGVLRSWAQTVEGLGFDLLMEEQQRRAPALAPRIALRLTGSPITDPRRVAGEGTIGQVAVASVPWPPTKVGPTAPSAFSPWHLEHRAA